MQAVGRAANPGGDGGDTSPQYLTSISPIIVSFAQHALIFFHHAPMKIFRGGGGGKMQDGENFLGVKEF